MTRRGIRESNPQPPDCEVEDVTTIHQQTSAYCEKSSSFCAYLQKVISRWIFCSQIGDDVAPPDNKIHNFSFDGAVERSGVGIFGAVTI